VSDYAEYEEKVNEYFNALPHTSFDNTACFLCGATDTDLSLFKKGTMTIKRCSNCQLVYNATPPNYKSLAAFYKESEAMNQWAKVKESPHEAKRQSYKYSVPLKWLKTLRVEKLLDFGCGDGFFLRQVKAECPEIISLGVEVNENARDIAIKSGVDVAEYWPGSLRFDCVSMFGVLEHMKSPMDVMQSAVSKLVERGFVMTIVPNVDSDVVKQLWEKCFTFCPQHLWYFSRETLKKLYKKVGLEEVHYQTIEREYIPWIRSRSGMDPYGKETPELPLFPSNDYQGYKIVSIAQKI